MTERGEAATRRRDLRALRVGLTVVNATCAVVTLAVGLLVVRELRDGDVARRGHAPTSRAFELPGARGIAEEPLVLAPRGTNVAPAPIWPTAFDDARVLRDPIEEFAHRWRVVFAGLEGEPSTRTCILESRAFGDQLTLRTGERVGTWLLMKIDPQPGAPRSVVLGFRELRRGDDFEVVMRADP